MCMSGLVSKKEQLVHPEELQGKFNKVNLQCCPARPVNKCKEQLANVTDAYGCIYCHHNVHCKCCYELKTEDNKIQKRVGTRGGSGGHSGGWHTRAPKHLVAAMCGMQ